MPAIRVPDTLRDRLGHDGALALHEFLEGREEDWSEDVLATATDRFEYRLMTEVSGLRLELREGLAAVHQEIGAMRFSVLKWMFLFWVGQIAAVAGLMNIMLRAPKP